ncbi:DUF2628 domain-containing protein [Sphaerotilus uruguayifluvii]|uniref:DUF2628 domain-containing protein n=1 Tax=Sphaerotilus uruguayifluvii TaxID=2735897 RepID=A0ABX2G0H7_9BURK|nr:hypothetical protein [Leptothrix sp. C29]
MKQYKVFRHPSGALESVRPGWSWSAFLLGCFWAFTLKMWGVGMAGLVALALVGVLVPMEMLGVVIFGVVLLLCHLAYGLLGPRWRMRHLLGRGYRHADTVTAPDPERALALAARYRGWQEAGEDALGAR